MKNSVIKKWICMVCGAAVIFSLQSLDRIHCQLGSLALLGR